MALGPGTGCLDSRGSSRLALGPNSPCPTVTVQGPRFSDTSPPPHHVPGLFLAKPMHTCNLSVSSLARMPPGAGYGMCPRPCLLSARPSVTRSAPYSSPLSRLDLLLSWSCQEAPGLGFTCASKCPDHAAWGTIKPGLVPWEEPRSVAASLGPSWQCLSISGPAPDSARVGVGPLCDEDPTRGPYILHPTLTKVRTVESPDAILHPTSIHSFSHDGPQPEAMQEGDPEWGRPQRVRKVFRVMK